MDVSRVTGGPAWLHRAGPPSLVRAMPPQHEQALSGTMTQTHCTVAALMFLDLTPDVRALLGARVTANMRFGDD
jgi:hypothetical protein